MKRKNRCTAKIILAPNPTLTTVCEPVGDGEDVTDIIRDMMHILVNSKTGVGLAANQAGHLKRIIIVKIETTISHVVGYRVMINPVICCYGKKKSTQKEGCLSYPKRFIDIKRSERIDYDHQDENRKNIVRTSFDLIARIIQHEIDHLNGQCKVGVN